MLGLKARWVGQSVPVRCIASGENKPRTRRTKEERRKMVESFIKKYQSRNTGKFPSLNLTHKEVGGSFYIIREIVREIIQENKVLGPGNPSSKVLNFEYCLEEGTDSSVDAHSELLIPGIGHELDYKTDSVEKAIEVSGERSTEMVKPSAQVMFESHEETSSEVMHVDLSFEDNASNGMLLHENLVNAGPEESNVLKLIVQKDGASRGSQKTTALVQLNSEEDPSVTYVKQQVASHGAVPDYSFVESEIQNEGKDSNVLMVTHSLQESAVATSTIERLSGTTLSFTETTNGQENSSPKRDNEFCPLDETLVQGGFSEKSFLLSISEASQISSSSDEVPLSSDCLVEGDVLNNVECQIAGFSGASATSRAFSSMNAVVVASILSDKEVPANNMQYEDILSFCESENHLLEDKSISSFLLPKNDIHLVEKTRSLADVCIEPENASSKLLEANVLEAVYSDFEAQKQTCSSSGNGGNFVSSSNRKAVRESEKLETNDFWAAMRAFVSSVIMFWSE